MFSSLFVKTLSILLFVILFSPHVYTQVGYIIGPQDVLEITVWDNPDLSGKVSISLDGFMNYQLIGKVKASGLTAPELADKITELLADGYIINPQVTVQVARYKSQKIFVVGEANKPGTYYLTKRTTLVEAISMAGGHAKDADREVIIVRPKNKKSTFGKNPLTPNQAEKSEMIKVDFRSALEGDLSHNVYVQNGDSIFIPKSKTFFIMGEVRNPGKYNLDKGTTMLNAISLAGGETDEAALSKTKIIRLVDGKKIERRVEMGELVKPDDVIIVPESFF